MYLTNRLDIAELALWTFGLFFFFLVIYLRREDRREGYPLEDDRTGLLQPAFTFLEEGHPKIYRLLHGGEVHSPIYKRDRRPIAAVYANGSANSGLVPTGDPLVDGVGPASWAERADHPDLNAEGHPRIVPLNDAAGFTVNRSDPDFRGWSVVGCDKRLAGTVTELWVDTSDRLVRYFEVELNDAAGAPGRRVLAPMFMSRVDRGRRTVRVDAIRTDQFARVPAIARPDRITLLEEDKIQGYYGGGFLYSTKDRLEPII